MKQSVQLSLTLSLFVFLLLSHSTSAAGRRLLAAHNQRLLAAHNQGEIEVQVPRFTYAASVNEIKEEDLLNLMGSEEEGCDDKDEECLKRRLIAEAHLDYIYTQHHKP